MSWFSAIHSLLQFRDNTIAGRHFLLHLCRALIPAIINISQLVGQCFNLLLKVGYTNAQAWRFTQLIQWDPRGFPLLSRI